MSETETETDPKGTDLVPGYDYEIDEIPGTAGIQSHPDPKQYVYVAIILVIVTAFEVAMSYVDFIGPNFIIAVLIAAAFAKFILVCGWYMHMKQDRPFFRRWFTVGIVLACFVYGVVFFMFASSVLVSNYNGGP